MLCSGDMLSCVLWQCIGHSRPPVGAPRSTVRITRTVPSLRSSRSLAELATERLLSSTALLVEFEISAQDLVRRGLP